MPAWFYDTYQLNNGNIDLDKLWADIVNHTRSYAKPHAIIIYGLKDEFGGYCSETDVKKIITGGATELRGSSPWRDDGCDYEAVYPPTDTN